MLNIFRFLSTDSPLSSTLRSEFMRIKFMWQSEVHRYKFWLQRFDFSGGTAPEV